MRNLSEAGDPIGSDLLKMGTHRASFNQDCRINVDHYFDVTKIETVAAMMINIQALSSFKKYLLSYLMSWPLSKTKYDNTEKLDNLLRIGIILGRNTQYTIRNTYHVSKYVSNMEHNSPNANKIII